MYYQSNCCFVRLFKKYHELIPDDRPSHAFQKPLGYHTLSNTVAHLCKEAGIPGYKTITLCEQLQLRTRLYESGVDEQLIMRGIEV